MCQNAGYLIAFLQDIKRLLPKQQTLRCVRLIEYGAKHPAAYQLAPALTTCQ